MTSDLIAYWNGRFVPPSELTLNVADAGFVSGVTVTDFCRTYRHQLFRWSDHLARFRHDCAACRVPLPYPDADLTAAAVQLVEHNARRIPESHDLALITFATPGLLGYMTGLADTGPPTIGMHTFPLPAVRYRRFFTEGVTLAVAGTLPSLRPAHVKHRSRLHWWLADHTVREPGSPFYCPGAVATLLDEHGTVADTAVGGVLAVVDGRVIRPPVGAVLESVSVNVVKELCGRLGRTFAEGLLDFRGASEVLLAGSGFGVAGVRRLIETGRPRDFTWPGPVLQQLIAAWSEIVRVDVAGQFTSDTGA